MHQLKKDGRKRGNARRRTKQPKNEKNIYIKRSKKRKNRKERTIKRLKIRKTRNLSDYSWVYWKKPFCGNFLSENKQLARILCDNKPFHREPFHVSRIYVRKEILKKRVDFYWRFSKKIYQFLWYEMKTTIVYNKDYFQVFFFPFFSFLFHPCFSSLPSSFFINGFL